MVLNTYAVVQLSVGTVTFLTSLSKIKNNCSIRVFRVQMCFSNVWASVIYSMTYVVGLSLCVTRLYNVYIESEVHGQIWWTGQRGEIKDQVVRKVIWQILW